MKAKKGFIPITKIIGICENWRGAEQKKTCISIRMNPDGDPLFHIKQSKNMRCFVSKKVDSK